MYLLETSFTDPASNLACDEVLLDLCEQGALDPVLRFWSPSKPFVVLGYSNNASREIDLEFCNSHKIPVLKRLSGGGAVLQGPGCLNYALLLEINRRFQDIRATNRYVLNLHRRALKPILGTEIRLRGLTDLALRGRKFSGNAQRRKRRFLLYHGTFLLGLDLGLMEKALKHPSREPDYRGGRSHKEFLCSLNCGAGEIRNALSKAWGAKDFPPSLTPKFLNRLVAAGKKKLLSEGRWIARGHQPRATVIRACRSSNLITDSRRSI
jgi:lipoate---protein ligase